MIRAMLWKEWREQRTVAASVLSFGALALYLTAQFAEPITGGSVWERGGPRELMALALAYLAGAVSGAILLADEKEVGTLEFLDTLPCRRRAIWIGKALAGGLITVGQCAALALLAIALGSTDDRMDPRAYGLVVLLVGVLAYAWGAFGGALARSTLGAVFAGSVSGFVFGFMLVVPFVAMFGARGFARAYGLPLFTYYGCWVAAGLAGSALVFTTVDQRRALRRRGPAAERVAPRKPWLAGLRALSWLTARQAVYVFAGAGSAAVIVGAIMLAPDAQPLFIWPGVTLTLGVLAGVTTLGEEQVRGVARFWAERRLPLGRLWLVKTACHFLLAAAGALVIGTFVFAASPSLAFRSKLTLELQPELFRFLALGLVYGFVVGHLTGMVFKKTVVAGLVAVVTAATLAGLILPSVIGGGAARWQVWAPAGVLLLTARLLLYPWATDRVAYRGPVLRALGGTGLAVAILAAGIGYRVVEVPAVPDGLEESGYLAALPIFEANESGRQVKAAATQYRQITQEASVQAAYPGVRPPGGPRRAVPLTDGSDPLVRVVRFGWTADSAALAPWLDLVFAPDWVRVLEDVADRPPGLYEDPRTLDHFSPPDAYQDLEEVAYALRARAAQRQTAGDPEAFPRLLRAGLAAVRAARNHAGLAGIEAALKCEQVLLGGVPDWLDRLDGRPDLVRRLLDTLARHEAAMPGRPTDTFWAEQIILRNTMDRVGSWLPRQLDLKAGAGVVAEPDAKADAEANLVGFAWQIPWERVRRERLLRVQTSGRVNPHLLSAIHQPHRWRIGFERSADAEADRRAATRRGFARLLAALRLYDLERGAPAPDLAALVPTYLPAVPDDPYTGRPFGYRVSAGELITAGSVLVSREDYVGIGVAASLAHPVGGLNGMWTIVRMVNTGPMRGPVANPPISVYQLVPAGYGILWSSGPDARDDGGLRSGNRGSPVNPGDDWIMLVRPAARGGP